MRDSEDKEWWCAEGVRLENKFLREVSVRGWDIEVAPDKANNPYHHDFQITVPSDLKSISTPFNTSEQKYGIPTEYAITINEKDFVRYAEKYPNIIILLDVKFPQSERRLFSITLPRARKLIQDNKAFRHAYIHRVDDVDGNAKASYVFDVRDLDQLI
jgi:hypothetical protein